jgi:hypothetical protein
VRQSARCIGTGAMALAMLFMIGLSAMARVTTGSVAGTVRTRKAGWCPVRPSLTSETRYPSSPAVTSKLETFSSQSLQSTPLKSRWSQDAEATNVR